MARARIVRSQRRQTDDPQLTAQSGKESYNHLRTQHDGDGRRSAYGTESKRRSTYDPTASKPCSPARRTASARVFAPMISISACTQF